MELDATTPSSVPEPGTRTPEPGRKTVLAPCMGVGKIVASVTRRAAYQVQSQCPDDVEILSLPALIAGDADERALMRDHPVVVIDGCALRCAAHIFELYGVKPVAKIEVNQVMKEKRIGPGKTRKELEETGRRLSDFTTERVLKALADEGLEADFGPSDALAQPPPEFAGSCHMTASSCVQAVEPAAPANENGLHTVKAVTVLPCQGIKRTGGRITQRAAYHVVEDRFLGKSQVLCISALAAGVQEDVDMLEKHPTVAVNGCSKNCATIAASHYGVPAVASVNLHEVDPAFDGERRVLEPDLTETEAREAFVLADAISAQVEKLLGSEIPWREGKIDLHGLVHRAGSINAETGYKDVGAGYLVQLAKARIAATPATEAVAAPVTATPAAEAPCVAPGMKSVVAGLFRPKPKPPSVL